MEAHHSHILVVDDEPLVAQQHAELCRALGYVASIESDPMRVCATLKARSEITCVLLDLRMPKLSGLKLLPQLVQQFPAVVVIVATVVTDLSDAIASLRVGAYNYLVKPLTRSNLKPVLATALPYSAPEARATPFSRFVTRDAILLGVLDRLLHHCHTDAPLAIIGEPGSGKRFLAGLAAAAHGSGSDEIFVLESPRQPFPTFFKRISDRSTGSIIIHELDRLGRDPQHMFAEYLRALDLRARANQRTPQIIVTASRSLAQMFEDGMLLAEIRFRLRGSTFFLTPLRQRKGDIRVLSDYFLKRYRAQFGRQIRDVSPDALEALQRYPFPGNVAELESLMCAAVINEFKGSLSLGAFGGLLSSPNTERGLDLREARRQQILDTLSECRGNQTQAAKRLGIARGTLNRLLKQFRDSRPPPLQKS